MTAPAKINKADLLRMATVAKELGVSVEVERDGFKIRVSPETEEKIVAPAKGIRL